MQIAIAGQKLPIAVPGDLDEKVTAVTGCSVAELSASIGTGPTPIVLAELLHPCIAGTSVPSKPKLAEMLATALSVDCAGTVAQVRRVLAGDAKPKRSAG